MITDMNHIALSRLQIVAAIAASGLVLAVVLFALDGWMQHGTAIFLTLAETGMSWCF
jgi:hypothetical protein